MQLMKTFTGTSRRSDLAEALADALKQASAEPSHKPDATIKWVLEEVRGLYGGFAGSEIAVTISTED